MCVGKGVMGDLVRWFVGWVHVLVMHAVGGVSGWCALVSPCPGQTPFSTRLEMGDPRL
jgi:hypothetical protein